MEVVLERDSTEESWGLVWHVQGYKAQNLGFSTATCFFLVVMLAVFFFVIFRSFGSFASKFSPQPIMVCKHLGNLGDF